MSTKPARGKRAALSLLKVHELGGFVTSLPGHKHMAQFLDELERGVIKSTPSTKALARAFRSILYDGAEPLKALKLTRKRGGKQPKSFGETETKAAPMVRFVIDQIRREKPATRLDYRDARANALDAWSARKSVDISTVRKQWNAVRGDQQYEIERAIRSRVKARK